MKNAINQQIALLGAGGVLLSSATIVALAAARTDGYSHLTKAVSELGSTDAPHQLLFNLLGYILPGLLIAGFAYGLRAQFNSRRAQLPFVLLAISGLLLTLAGICPMDMSQRAAPVSLLHAAGSLGSGLAWLLCAFTLGRPLRSQPAWLSLAIPLQLLTWTGLLLIVLIGVVSPATPGLGQRVSFAVYFLFVLLLARRLYSLKSTSSASGLPAVL
jgi:hypothetical membrane protein